MCVCVRERVRDALMAASSFPQEFKFWLELFSQCGADLTFPPSRHFFLLTAPFSLFCEIVLLILRTFCQYWTVTQVQKRKIKTLFFRGWTSVLSAGFDVGLHGTCF